MARQGRSPYFPPAGGGLTGGGGGGGGSIIGGGGSGGSMSQARGGGGLISPAGGGPLASGPSYMFPIVGGGALPSSSSKYKGEFTSMTALATYCTAIGDIAYLVGLDTGEPILLARRVDVGANGIAWQGMVEVMQSSGGAEFDGIFAWDPVGLAGNPTWGVPGVESTGGVDPAIGALRLGGFAPFRGLRRAVYAEWYLEALPTVPATADSLLAGLLPAAATTSDYYAGGLGYNSGSIRSVVSANGNPSTPGLAYSGSAGVPSIGNKLQTHLDSFKTAGTSDSAFYVGAWSQGNNSPTGSPPTGAAAGLDASNDTFNFTISKINDWVARLIRFCVLPVYG